VSGLGKAREKDYCIKQQRGRVGRHSGPAWGGWNKALKPAKEGTRPYETGGSCRSTKTSGKLREESELKRERNTSQLPMQLC
jgi:hypothetical protein